MTGLEIRAYWALRACSMRIASKGKRFRNQLAENDVLTAAQALFLWQLVYVYRRQIADKELVEYGRYATQIGELPPIYKEGDHRERVVKPKRQAEKRNTRLEDELKRGGGKLKL